MNKTHKRPDLFAIRSKIQFLVIFLFLSTFSSCERIDDNIPYVYVSIQINLSDAEFSALHAIGNSVLITGGYKGIILHRKSIDQIIALDRACPFDPNCARVTLDDSGTLATDDCCGSQFSVVLDGAVITGPAELPLRNYQTSFNTNTNTLFIEN